VKISNKRLTRD